MKVQLPRCALWGPVHFKVMQSPHNWLLNKLPVCNLSFVHLVLCHLSGL